MKKLVDTGFVTLTQNGKFFAINNAANQYGAFLNKGFGAGPKIANALVDELLDDEQKRELAYRLLAETNAKAVPVATKSMKPAPQRQLSNLAPLAIKVFQHMQRAGSISAREAMSDHGITSASLARRICDIEAEGFAITRDRRIHPLTKQAYTRYSLAPVQVAA